MQSDQAEFDSCHYDLLQRLSGRMKWAGSMLLVYVCLGTAQSLLELQRDEFSFVWKDPFFPKFFVFVLVLQVLGPCLLGVWTLQSGQEFMQIVETKGNDLTHLMKALQKLLKVYSFIYWYLVLSFVLFTLWILVVFHLMSQMRA
ncbi:MAG: hypothetical protein U0931_13580 [Vulcanimicrobiota bacterium]